MPSSSVFDTLTPNAIRVCFKLYSLCYKGSRLKCFREIKTSALSKTCNLSYQQTRDALELLVKSGLFEKITTTFAQQHQSKKFWARCSYYRIGESFPH